MCGVWSLIFSEFFSAHNGEAKIFQKLMWYKGNFWRFSSIPDAAEPPKDTEQKTEEEKKKEEEKKEKEKKKDSEQEKTEAGKLPDAEQKVVAL